MLKVKVSETDSTDTGLALFPSLHHYESRTAAQDYYIDSNESFKFCQEHISRLTRRSTVSTSKERPLLPKARGGFHINDSSDHEHMPKKKQDLRKKLFRHKVIIHT